MRGRPLSGGLGGYEVVANAHYSLRAVARWVVFHAAELSFAVALIPVSALIIMFGLACTRRFATTSAERAFLAVAAASLLFIVQAGAFASQFILRIEERNMIYVEPVLLLAFVLWLERGAPRPQRLTLVAFLVPVALLTSIPFERLFNVSIFSDTTGLLPLFRVSALVSGGTDGMRVLLVLGALAVMVFAALASTRVLVVGGLIGVALFLGVSTKMVVGSQRSQAVAARLDSGASDVNWVDDRLPKGETAALLFNSDLSADGHPAWQTEFWNRDVQRVVYLGARDFGFPGFDASVSPTGRLSPANGTATRPARGRLLRRACGRGSRRRADRDGRPFRPLARLEAVAAGDTGRGLHRRRVDRGRRDVHAVPPGSEARPRRPLAPQAAGRPRRRARGARLPGVDGRNAAVDRSQRQLPHRSGSGRRRRRSRFGSMWLRPSRRRTWASRTRASSECSRA